MNSQSPTRSALLQPDDPLPEMELRDLVRLLKVYFNLYSNVQGRPYAVRISDSANAFKPDSLSITVYTHNRGRYVSPYVIKQVLAKFEITEEDFKNNYNLLISSGESEDQTDDPEPAN